MLTAQARLIAQGETPDTQVRTRGVAGGADEFVELYNPTPVAVTLDSTWKLQARNGAGTCTSNSYATKFTGAGQTIAPRSYLLLAGSGYTQQPARDAALGSITDASSLVLFHGPAVADALCFYFNGASQTNLTTCSTAYTCEGTPVSNSPHNDGTSAASNSDVSLERRPGGPDGNGQETADNATDFQSITPARPRSSASGPSPP
jgi:hypothetical protein